MPSRPDRLSTLMRRGQGAFAIFPEVLSWDLPDPIGNRSRGQMILQIPAWKGRFSMTNVTLTASEFQDHVGEAFDRSLSQPVVITKHGRPPNVVMSYGEYERLSARDRRAARVEDLSDDKLAAIGAWVLRHSYLWRMTGSRAPKKARRTGPASWSPPP